MTRLPYGHPGRTSERRVFGIVVLSFAGSEKSEVGVITYREVVFAILKAELRLDPIFIVGLHLHLPVRQDSGLAVPSLDTALPMNEGHPDAVLQDSIVGTYSRFDLQDLVPVVRLMAHGLSVGQERSGIPSLRASET